MGSSRGRDAALTLTAMLFYVSGAVILGVAVKKPATFGGGE
jgi:hypothetical protein